MLALKNKHGHSHCMEAKEMEMIIDQAQARLDEIAQRQTDRLRDIMAKFYSDMERAREIDRAAGLWPK